MTNFYFPRELGGLGERILGEAFSLLLLLLLISPTFELTLLLLLLVLPRFA
jgi:hypothetical protein